MDQTHKGNEFLFKSTPRYKKYNKMEMDDGHHGVGAADGDRDDDQASLDPSSGEDRCPLQIPSRGEVLRFLVSMNVGYVTCLHGVKLFEETKSVEGRTTTLYRQAMTVPMVTKLSDCFILSFFLSDVFPHAKVNIFIGLNGL
jgi:hypothetical protein